MSKRETAARRADDEYLAFDPFGDDRDVDIRLQTVRIVTTRKPHNCASPVSGDLHPIEPGTRARFEKALVDGEWGSYYTCLDCIDKFEDFGL